MILLYISDEKLFTYDGHPSYLYGLKFCYLNTSSPSKVIADKTYSRIANRSQNSFTITGTKYEDPLSFDVELCSDRVFTEPEVRQIYSVYFDKNQFKELSIPADNGEIIYFNCIFTNIEKIEGGISDSFGVVGFKATVVCDAPWAWSEEYVVIPKIEIMRGGIRGFVIHNDTDSQDYIYPEVTIVVPGSNEISSCTRIGESQKYSCSACSQKENCWNKLQIPKKAMLINTSDSSSRGLCLLAGELEQKIVMKPKVGLIVDNNGSNKVKETNKLFVRLVPGDNVFMAENIKEIKFKYREARILI